MSGPLGTTVMGPGGGSTPGTQDYLSPPILTTNTNMFKWRKQVDLWLTTVKLYARGGDKKAKGMLSALGITLYKVLDEEYSSTIEEAIATGTINLEAEDDDVMNPTKQLSLVRSIIALVAKDSPTEGIRRLVNMMREVFSCTRKDGESPARFAKRFKSIAQEYINHSHTSLSDQDSQNFAMLMLENAKLPADVHSSVITRIVAIVTERPKEPHDQTYILMKSRVESILEHIDKIETAISSESQPALQVALKNSVNAIKKVAEHTVESNESQKNESSDMFNIKLADACFVLSDHHAAFPISAAVVHAGGDPETAKKLGTMLGKREFQDSDRNKGYRDKRQKGTIPSGQGPKAQSRCRACKMPNHWYKDPECVYNIIRSIMENKDIDSSVVQKLTPRIRELFKDSAGGYKTKAPIGEIVKVMEQEMKHQSHGNNKPKETASYFQ